MLRNNLPDEGRILVFQFRCFIYSKEFAPFTDKSIRIVLELHTVNLQKIDDFNSLKNVRPLLLRT
jgi:hypothetical protein